MRHTTKKTGDGTLSRRDLIEQGSAVVAAGLLLSSCPDGGPDAGPDGALPDGDGDLDGDAEPDGDAESDGDADGGTACSPGELPDDPYEDCRVVRVYDRRVTTYAFGEDEVCWQHIDAGVIREMLDAALIELARVASIGEAWRALLLGDLGSARIAVKANLNGDEPHFINTSPAMMIALSSSLVEAGAVAENITIFDVSRRFPGVYRDSVLAAVPGLVLLGGGDVPLHETEVVAAPTLVLEDGSHVTCAAPVCLVEADHFVNLHVLKGHFGGSTGSMKNLFGLARNVMNTFHGRGNLGQTRYEVGRQCADLATQPLVRGKSRVLISEGVYGTWWHANKPPDRFRDEDLFPGGMPCCVTVSRNPLYHDTVLYDLIAAERAYEPLDEGYSRYPDDWLRFCTEEPYLLGVLDHGRVVEGTFTASDLAYDHLDYRSFTTHG